MGLKHLPAVHAAVRFVAFARRSAVHKLVPCRLCRIHRVQSGVDVAFDLLLQAVQVTWLIGVSAEIGITLGQSIC